MSVGGATLVVGSHLQVIGDSEGIGGQVLPMKKAFTRLEHICELDIDTVVHTCKRTGVIGTIGEIALFVLVFTSHR